MLRRITNYGHIISPLSPPLPLPLVFLPSPLLFPAPSPLVFPLPDYLALVSLITTAETHQHQQQHNAWHLLLSCGQFVTFRLSCLFRFAKAMNGIIGISYIKNIMQEFLFIFRSFRIVRMNWYLLSDIFTVMNKGATMIRYHQWGCLGQKRHH